MTSALNTRWRRDLPPGLRELIRDFARFSPTPSAEAFRKAIMTGPMHTMWQCVGVLVPDEQVQPFADVWCPECLVFEAARLEDTRVRPLWSGDRRTGAVERKWWLGSERCCWCARLRYYTDSDSDSESSEA